MLYRIFIIFALIIFLSTHGNIAVAQDFEKILSGSRDDAFEILDDEHQEFIDDSYRERDRNKQKVYIYEDVTLSNLSKLYWGIGFINSDDDVYIDNYIKINECDLYNAYSAQEFEWKKIRTATRQLIEKNKGDFPTRLQFVQPLKLLDYDLNKKQFSVDPEFQYKGTRRIEVFAKDMNETICGDTPSFVYTGYTKGIMLELSRPFSLETVSVSEEVAKSYIDTITQKMRKLRIEYQNKKTMNDMKKAYLVLKIKIFAHGKVITPPNGIPTTQMYGALEAYEIFSDPNLKTLLFSKNYVVRTDSTKKNARMFKEFDILKDRSKNGGILMFTN